MNLRAVQMRNEMLSFFRGAGFHEELCILLTFFFLIKEVKKKNKRLQPGIRGLHSLLLVRASKKGHTDLKS